MNKILVFDNIPTNYRDSLYSEINSLSNTHSITVVYNSKNENTRNLYEGKVEFNRIFLKSFLTFKYGRAVTHNLNFAFPNLNLIRNSDLIIITGYLFPVYFIVATFCLIFSKKLVFYWEVTQPVKSVFKNLLLKYLRFCANKLYIQSQEAQNYFSSIGIATDGIVHNGVNLKDFYSYNNHNREFDFIFVNRLEPEKGIDKLINFFNYLSTRSKKYKFLIVGDGLHLENLKIISKNYNNVEITFLGWIESKELIKYYNNSKILISTSNFETWGLSITEALACGCFIISSKYVTSAVEYSYYTKRVMISDFSDFSDIDIDSIFDDFKFIAFDTDILSINRQVLSLLA